MFRLIDGLEIHETLNVSKMSIPTLVGKCNAAKIQPILGQGQIIRTSACFLLYHSHLADYLSNHNSTDLQSSSCLPNCVRGVVGQETSFDGPKSLRCPRQ